MGELIVKAALVSESRIEGHVLDPDDLDSRFVVELMLDGYSAAVARANRHDPDLEAAGRGDGRYRFVFSLSRAILEGARLIEVRLANSGRVVGNSISVPKVRARRDVGPPPSHVEWKGGLRIWGWFAADGDSSPKRARAIVDGAFVAEARAHLWSNAGDGERAEAVRAFDLHLPKIFADGRVRHVRVIDDSGADLLGSPVTVIAFADGLERFIEAQADLESERLRGRLYDDLIPQSLPMSDFASWARAFPPDRAIIAGKPKIAAVVIGDLGLEETLRGLESQVDCDWVAGSLPSTVDAASFAPADLGQLLREIAGDSEYVVFAPSGTVFHPHALSRLAEALRTFPRSKLAYCDLTIIGAAGAEWPLALTAFDYERMLEQGYCAFAFICRLDHAKACAEGGVGDLFRVFNSALDASGPAGDSAPAHAPGFLARLPRLDMSTLSPRLAAASRAHLAIRQVRAEAHAQIGEIFPCARIQRMSPRSKVSILIPTRDRLDLLRPCLESLERTVEGLDVEYVVIDNDSSDPETLEFLADVSARGVRVGHVRGPFNFSRVINAGASIASGEFLLLINNDVEAKAAGWLEEMLGRASDPNVGAVGALLVWPSGVVQHGGVTVGLNFAAGHAFNERLDGDLGYADLLNVAHEGSAVTAACLLTRRRLFQDLGGFDGMRFPVNFNDVDYCLRLRALGYRIVMTPHAKLTHHESASRGRDLAPDASSRHKRELYNLRLHWGEALGNEPFYSPMLGLDGTPYSSLAWPPRSQAPRLPRAAAHRPAPPGF